MELSQSEHRYRVRRKILCCDPIVQKNENNSEKSETEILQNLEQLLEKL